MNGPDENDLPPELLAAYVDGELSPEMTERVEQWLAVNPDALQIVDDQAMFSSNQNEELPPIPMPKAKDWANCLAGIHQDLANRPRFWNWQPVWASLAVAAALFVAVWVSSRDHFQPLAFMLPDDDADEEMLVLANQDDIEIVCLPESAAHLLLVGRQPLMEDLVLARSYELEFIGVGSDADGRFPDVPTDPTADEVPLLWSPVSP